MLREYASCEHCGEPIDRYPGGMWEHSIDLKLDWDHLPEPDLEPLTEAEAEEELGWRAEDLWEATARAPASAASRDVTVAWPSRAYL